MGRQINITGMHDGISRERVFVYGSLRRGERNHFFLDGQTRLGACQTDAAYALFDTGPYPAAVAGSSTALSGEVYAVDAACFAQLDVLEDYPHSYTRAQIATPWGRAWIYLWIAAVDPAWRRLPGDWCARPVRRVSFE